MPIHPPAHPDWLDMPRIPAIKGAPSMAALKRAQKFHDLAKAGRALRIPGSLKTLREASAYLETIQSARSRVASAKNKDSNVSDVPLAARTGSITEATKGLLRALNNWQAFRQRAYNWSHPNHWFPVANHDDAYPSAANLPRISGAADISLLDEMTVKKYLDFYKVRMGAPPTGEVWELAELKQRLVLCFTSH